MFEEEYFITNLDPNPERRRINDGSMTVPIEFSIEGVEEFGKAVRKTIEKDTQNDFNNITHPSHYCEGREYEPRKVIEDWNLDFYLGNVVKYISRAGRKDSTLEDLQKAKQYLDWEIEKLNKEIK